jgi:hypothetical protein
VHRLHHLGLRRAIDSRVERQGGYHDEGILCRFYGLPG